jgi:hypothetical protein
MAVEVSHEKFVVGNYSDRKEKKKELHNSRSTVLEEFMQNSLYIQVLGIHQLLQHHPTKIFSQVFQFP